MKAKNLEKIEGALHQVDLIGRMLEEMCVDETDALALQRMLNSATNEVRDAMQDEASEQSETKKITAQPASANNGELAESGATAQEEQQRPTALREVKTYKPGETAHRIPVFLCKKHG